MKQAALPHQNFLEILHSPWGSSTIQLKWLHQGKTYIQTFFCFLGIKLLEVYLPLRRGLVHPGDVHTMGNTEDCNAREPAKFPKTPFVLNDTEHIAYSLKLL